MRAYSTDLKERVVRAVANGQPRREAARRFGVAVTTVKRAVGQERETGSLERQPIPGCPRRMGAEQEAAEQEAAEQEAAGGRPRGHRAGALCLVGGAPGAAAERGHPVAGDPPAGLDTHKKSLAASERDEAARTAWREAAAQLDPQQVVLVDESGTTSALTQLSGWAPHDQRATGSVPRNPGKHTTVVAALAPDGLLVPWLIEGAMDTATFVWDLTQQLGPTLRPGQVVGLENLSVHQAASIRQASEARHCQLLFLPPSSPDCTPIEQAFSKIKAILRRLGARTKEALWEARRVAVEAITREEALAWFAHAGYALSAPAT